MYSRSALMFTLPFILVKVQKEERVSGVLKNHNK